MNEDKYKYGLYSYKDKASTFSSLPERLKGKNMTPSCAILQIFMGAMTIYDDEERIVYRSRTNYIDIPFKTSGDKNIQLSDYKRAFGVENFDEINKIDHYLINDQKNNNVYKNLLRELTLAMVYLEKSPCETFVHIYRMYEFLSYTFPLLYVSKSKNYKGSYDSLRRFFGDDNKSGELKFFARFLNELFDDEDEAIKSIIFDILIDSKYIDDLTTDLQITISPKDNYVIDGNTLKISFSKMRFLLIEIRNKFFHMLAGREGNNFETLNYDINDLFKSLNPYFINWISSIYVAIFQYGIHSID